MISNKIRQPRVCVEKCPNSASPTPETPVVTEPQSVPTSSIEDIAVEILNGTDNGTIFDNGTELDFGNATLDMSEYQEPDYEVVEEAEGLDNFDINRQFKYFTS